jgi:hypothetical protein
MNDSALHKFLANIATPKVTLPLNQKRAKQRVLQHGTNKQTSARFSAGTFISNLKEGFVMRKNINKRRLVFSPLAVAVAALIVTGTVGAAAYWFRTTVLSSQQGDMVNITVKDCSTRPLSELKAVGAPTQGPSTFNEKYKILDASYITEQEIATARIAECEQRAIAGIINKHFPDMQEFSASDFKPNSRGLYFPLYETGVVVSVANNTITVGDLNSLKAEVASTQTIQLSDDVLVLNGDTQTTLRALKPGDQIYFAYQNKKIAGEEPVPGELSTLQRLTDINERSVIRGIGKLQIDYHAWHKLIHAINTHAVEVIEWDPSQG